MGQVNDIDSLKTLLKKTTVHDTLKIKALNQLAFKYLYSDIKKSQEFVDRSFKNSTRVKWNKGIALSHMQQGNIYYVRSDFKSAQSSFQSALKLAEKYDYKRIINSVKNNLANLYAEINEPEKALEIFRGQLTKSEEKNDTLGILRALTNIGVIHLDLAEYEQGKRRFESALIHAEVLADSAVINVLKLNLGVAYKKLLEYDKALLIYKEQLLIAQKGRDKTIEINLLNNIAIIEVLQKDFNKAIMNANQALKLSKELGALSLQRNSLEVLANANEGLDQWELASEYYKRWSLVKDSILNEDKKSEVTRAEMQYELDRQKIEANSEIEKQSLIKKFAFVLSLMLAFLGVLGFSFYKRKRDAETVEQRAMLRSELDKKELLIQKTELKALRAQMSPHFIFNALNSISSYMMENDAERASEYLIKFSSLTRGILESSEKKWISLEEDLELIQLYLQIESIRLNHKLEFTIHVAENIYPENLLMAPLITQPFIENSVWHGIAPKKASGKISVQIRKEDNGLTYEITDDGVGFQPEEKEQLNKTSMGSQISVDRLNIINEEIDFNGEIKVLKMKQGVKVVCRLPLIEEF